jgi:uncharacterized protein YjbI with pentapeptide repeats
MTSVTKQESFISKLFSSTNILIPIISVILGFLYFFLPFELQKKKQENDLLIDLIKQATTASSPQGRIAGVWMLESYWRTGTPSTHKLIVNALGGLISSDENAFVRLASAEMIGNAYNTEDLKAESRQRIEELKLLLYGNGNNGEYGVVTSVNWLLQVECNKANLEPKAKFTCEAGLQATKEAIRKNWEDLSGVHLAETDLTSARLYEANLNKANLSKANLMNASLENADLRRSNLLGTNLKNAKLVGANLAGAIYSNKTIFTDLSKSVNVEKMLKIEPNSNLKGANLSGFPLNGADLTGADLTKANLENTNLSYVALNRSNLRGTNLKGAVLNGTKLKDAEYDNSTEWPQGYDYIASGAVMAK